MSKKDFIAIADIIRRHNSEVTSGSNSYFGARHLDILAQVFRQQNPAFKTDRWLGYIAGTNGQNGGKIK